MNVRGASTVLSALLLASSAGAQSVAPLPEAVKRAEAVVTPAALEAPVRFLADDLLEGRAPSHIGDVLSRRYLASTMELLGLEPGFAGGRWEQEFDIVGITSKAPETWSFDAGGKAVAMKYWTDYIATSGVQRPEAGFDGAEVVFVGYGIVAPEYRWDDIKGADLKGKVLLMLNNDPDWDPALFEGARRLYYGRWTYKYEEAARLGAAGAIIIHTDPSAGYPWRVVQNSWSKEQFELPAGGGPRIQVSAWATHDAAARLVAAAGKDLATLEKAARSRDFRPVPLGITTSLHLTSTVSRARTGNVCGMIRGSDPTLKAQYVAFSAHHDHLGVGRPDETGDRIFNGARDNASGVAEVLAIARQFKALPSPPRRSLLFVFVTAEESGLLGSAYFAAHPPVPAADIVADINFDAGNIFGRTKDVAQVGTGKSTLDGVLRRAAAEQNRVVTGEAFPEQGSFYRSDQFSFAKIGVPCLYFGSGVDYVGRPEGWGRKTSEAWTAAHYHRPSDELDGTWNYDGMIEDTQLGFVVGWMVSQADSAPQWLPGDEFAHLRPPRAPAGSRPAGH